jgi:hypothetical protein
LFGGSGGQERNRIAVALTLDSGETVHGHLFGTQTGRLRDAINSAESYLEVEKRDGTVVFLAKRTIASLRSDEPPRTDQLARRAAMAQGLDPFATLGIDRTAGPNEIKTAY